ncbi:MAG: M4 family metallopeptidase, partial [Planctomycetota bacterium]
MRGAFAVALIWAQCVLLGTVSAQSLSGDVEKGRSPATGRVHHITGPEGTALLLPQGVKPDLSDAYQALNIYGEHLGIKFPEQELEMVRTERCSLGQIHHTFQQVYLGVDVFSGVIKVHLNPDGSPLTINGDFYPMPKKFGITPAITEEEALIFAEAALEQSVLVQTADSELVIANPGWWGDAPLAQPVLAHHLVLESPEMLAEHVLIDAMTGALVDHWPAVHSALFREVYDGIAGGLPGNLARTEGEAATGDADIDNAYDTSGDLYRLLFDGLGRDSLDGAGFTMTSTVHWNDGICPNAIWNGNQSAFCNGLATDDVVAHEFAHGLTQFTADLIYQNQSGQLNEAFSDIFGEAIDLWNGDVSSPGAPGGTPWPVGSTGGGLDTPNTARTACNDGSARWRMGEETSLDAIRDMWFPECFNDPPSTTDPLYNQNACGPFDNGGVHIGSGVLNHSFAMLVDGKDFNGQTVGSIGLTKTAAVYFRALTVYMTAGTDFPEAETLINQAAADLINSAPNDPRTGNPGDLFTQGDADQVATAMIAVGMSEAVCGQVPPGPPPANDACAGSVPVFVGLNDIDSNNATSGGPPGDSTQCDGTFLGDVGNDIWYSYVAPEDGLLTVSTCNIANWDTDLLVYSGTCGGGLTQLACNGDFGGCSTFTSTVENVPVTGGETYRIRVASWSDGTTGTGQLDVAFVGGGGGQVENCTNGTDDDGDGQIDCDDTDCATNPACVPVAPGDECLTATVAIVGVNPLDTTTATQSADPYDDALCTGTALGQMVNDVWFQFTAPITGDYTISTCDTIDFDSDLFVYTGAC